MAAPALSGLDLPFIIQSQSLDCSAADAGQTLEMYSIVRPAEMAAPALPARIEQPRRFFAPRIEACLKSQFLEFTAITAQGQVCGGCGAATAFRKDMIQTKPMGKETLRRVTVFTPMSSTVGYTRIITTQVSFARRSHLFL
jgi:hypothetical protein